MGTVPRVRRAPRTGGSRRGRIAIDGDGFFRVLLRDGTDGYARQTSWAGAERLAMR